MVGRSSLFCARFGLIVLKRRFSSVPLGFCRVLKNYLTASPQQIKLGCGVLGGLYGL